MSDTSREVPTRLERLRDAELPVTELGPEVLAHLRRPFAPAAVKWKVQTEIWERVLGTDTSKTHGAILVAYIDARLVYERLNLVWPWWREKPEAAGSGATRRTLELYDPSLGWVMGPKSDVGMGGDIKTMESDSVKRVAVHFGIGVSIYALAQVKRLVGTGRSDLRTELRRKKNRQTNQWEEKPVPIIDAATLGWLTEKYELWLAEKGEALFGPVLDHGDELGAQGVDLEAPVAAAEAAGGEPVAETQEPGPQPLTDDRAVELRTTCEGYYAQFRKLAPRRMPPAVFQTRLLEASVSHDGLEAFAAELEGLVLEAGGDGGA